MDNKIIIAMDMPIKDGIDLMMETADNPKIYGYKIGSLWIFRKSVEILERIGYEIIDRRKQKIILDMQKWGSDAPFVIEEQVKEAKGLVDELICCSLGSGRKSLEAFAKSCLNNSIKPICVIEMTQPDSNNYLALGAKHMVLRDALSFGITSFVIPATKTPDEYTKDIIFAESKNRILKVELYATGFKTQGGLKPMVNFGVTKFIVGRAIYEADNPIEEIDKTYKEINEV